MSTCSDIDRLIANRSSAAKDTIDQAVRKSVETQRSLERYKAIVSHDARMGSKYQRLADNFSKVCTKLEDSMKRYTDRCISAPDAGQSTQLKVMSEVSRSFSRSSNSYKPPSAYEYISSMEDGTQAQTLQDLTRINKDMSSLQDIYVSLSEAAGSQQGSLIDSVQSKLSKASQSASAAVTELARAKDRMDYWTKLKVYTVSGLATVGLLIWIV
jgi:hypothetical protein